MALGIVILFKIVELQQRSVADELGNGMVNIGHCYLSFLLNYFVTPPKVGEPTEPCRGRLCLFLH